MKLYFRHIGRDCNGLADWAGRVARHATSDVDLTPLCTHAMPFGPPPTTPEEAAGKQGGFLLLRGETCEGCG